MTQSHKLQHEPVRARRCRGLPNAGERISKQRTLCAQGLHHRSGSPWSQSEVCHWTTTTSGSGHDSRKNLVFVVGANSAKEWDLVSFEESRIWVELGVLLEYFGAVSSCVSVQRYPPPSAWGKTSESWNQQFLILTGSTNPPIWTSVAGLPRGVNQQESKRWIFNCWF